MKKVFLIISLVLPLLISCKKKGYTDPTIATNYNQHYEQNDGTCEYEVVENALPLIINENLTLTNDKIWYLVGRSSVESGTVLTIQLSTIIKGKPGTV